MRAIIASMTVRSPASVAGARAQHLQRAAHPASGLRTSWATTAASCPSCASAACSAVGLGRLPLRDVAADGEVLPRLPALVEERDDRRVDPVVTAILGAVPDLAAPDVPLRDRPPQVPDELLRVVAGVDDAVILAEQLVA